MLGVKLRKKGEKTSFVRQVSEKRRISTINGGRVVGLPVLGKRRVTAFQNLVIAWWTDSGVHPARYTSPQRFRKYHSAVKRKTTEKNSDQQSHKGFFVSCFTSR